MQLRARHIARNVIFNWVGAALSLAVGFFLSPFILHRLGNLQYGVWVLAVSAVGYLRLLDLGMGNSVIRFVSKGYVQGDHQAASDAISAAFWVRIQMSGIAILASVGLAVAFPHIFQVPPQLATDARVSVLLIGATAALTLSVGVYNGVLNALNRYDLQNYVFLTQTVIRVLGIIYALSKGHGIVAIAICELGAVIGGNVLLIHLARTLYPELRIQLKKPKRETLVKVWSYSAYAFITSIAIQLINQTDNMVVGAFVSTAAVTFYAIANSLCRYANQLVGAMGTTFVPAASTYEAAGNSSGLLALYKNGTRAVLIISLPITVTFIIRGSSFIRLWMGPQYEHQSGLVLLILSVSTLFAFANQSAGAISFGVEKHRTVALFTLAEGAANLILSVVLAHRYGIYGVALGTTIPSLVMQLVFWPGYVSKLVGLSRTEVFAKVWAPVMLAAVPFALASFWMDRHWQASSLAMFALQELIALAIFLSSVGLVFRDFFETQVLSRVRSKLSMT